MSIIQPIPKPVVPCSICHVNMVELGPMGDTGKKKCQDCKNRFGYERRKISGNKYYKLRQAICVRCGKKYEGTAKKVCQTCQLVIIDLYNHFQNKDCIYCGKPCGKKDFCSRICGSNTFNLMGKRKKKIDEVIKDC